MAVVLLVLAVAGIYARRPPVPAWAAPAAAALIALATHATSLTAARDTLRHLGPALAFLVAAVPLATLLDRIGFFAAIAGRVDRADHLRWWLWVFAAAVTVGFNLDAAVVLLTPLYVRIAIRHDVDPLELAVIPVLLAALASSALPVANLTNLIVVARTHVTTADFVVRLGPATLTSVGIGWLTYRRWVRGRNSPIAVAMADPTRARPVAEVSVERALHIGVPVVGFVLVGFVFGPFVSVPAWSVAAVADVALLAMVGDRRRLRVPWSAVITVSGLGITAVAAAHELPLNDWLRGPGLGGDVRALVASALGANAINNLPALLIALPTALLRSGRIWVVLFAVNAAPTLLLTGTLAALLWRDAAKAVGVDVRPRHYSEIGLRIGTPAFLAGAVVLLVSQALLR